ncbi:oxidoreductase [Horticoccus sp. 23ND18S-11]|uniref:oxidoreductase n=1 Tax=Horticoccus sp. 23ND18S-11 TaxID=3391832 RepID=UPI0039C970F7
MRLKDKVIIVTGGTSGIGKAIAERVVAEGARVLVHGIERHDGEKLVAQLGAHASLHLDDLIDPASPKRIAAAAVAAFGRIDAVVNNAAIVARSNLESTEPAFFDRMMAVNLRAPLFLIQAAFPQLKANRGCVLNIGSINAHSGQANLLDYSLSKGAMQTLSRNLANAHATDHVRVNHLNVGWVLTAREYAHQVEHGMPLDWPEKVPAQYAPSGRLMMPEEIAAAAVYWLGDESRPVSGAVVDMEQFSLIGRNPNKSSSQ